MVSRIDLTLVISIKNKHYFGTSTKILVICNVQFLKKAKDFISEFIIILYFRVNSHCEVVNASCIQMILTCDVVSGGQVVGLNR